MANTQAGIYPGVPTTSGWRCVCGTCVSSGQFHTCHYAYPNPTTTGVTYTPLVEVLQRIETVLLRTEDLLRRVLAEKEKADG